ncbi:MAG TPA: hypothetical protein VHX13_10085 [Acidobacteriaceae bacterium]|jgi:type II secretory pathway pseudopilin PulG|nr:hypothetical protein [Acidobacteriaceae bacterium]
MSSPPQTPQRDAEGGFVLLAAIFLCVLLLISVAIAAPKMARSIQRDKELETIHRGEQYRRAIQLYYRKFNNYPTSIDQLVETNQMRFLRKKYADPLTGKDDWKPVYFGRAHVRPLGFFGQPLMAAAGMAGVAGVSSSMYAPLPVATDANGVPVAPSDSSATGSASSASGSGVFGSSPSTPGSGFGSSSGSGFGSSSGTGFGSSSGSSFGSGSSMFSNSQSSPMGSSPTSATGSSGFGASSGTAGGVGGTSASTFGGGGPIVGFTLPVKKPSLIDYMKQTSYDHWEFNYDPMADQAQAMAGLAGGAGSANGTNGLQNTSSPSSTMPQNTGSTLMSPNNSTTNSPDNSTTQPQ